MPAPTVDAGSYEVSLAADGKAYTRPTRWASTSPFNVSVSGGTSPEFRIKDPGGTWGAWRNSNLSIVGTVVTTAISIPSVSGANSGAVTESSAVTISNQGHQIQVRDTASSTAGASVSPAWTIGGQSGSWTAITTPDPSRTDIIFTCDFSSVTEDVINPASSTRDAYATATLDGFQINQAFYERIDAGGSPPAAPAVALPHVEISDTVPDGEAVSPAVGGGRAALIRIYSPWNDPLCDYSAYHEPGRTNAAAYRARTTLGMNRPFSENIWNSARFAGTGGYRQSLWVGFSMWLPSDWTPLSGTGTYQVFSTWLANSDIANTVWSLQSFAFNSSIDDPTENNLLGFVFTTYKTGGSAGAYTEPQAGSQIYLPWSASLAGTRNYFVVNFNADDRDYASGGRAFFKVWHNRHGDTPTLLGQNVCTAESDYQFGAASYMNVDSSTTGFNGGIKPDFRIYMPQYYSTFNAGTYNGQNKNTDYVITVGFSEIRVGGPDSDFASVHPTGQAQP